MVWFLQFTLRLFDIAFRVHFIQLTGLPDATNYYMEWKPDIADY